MRKRCLYYPQEMIMPLSEVWCLVPAHVLYSTSTKHGENLSPIFVFIYRLFRVTTFPPISVILQRRPTSKSPFTTPSCCPFHICAVRSDKCAQRAAVPSPDNFTFTLDQKGAQMCAHVVAMVLWRVVCEYVSDRSTSWLQIKSLHDHRLQ